MIEPWNDRALESPPNNTFSGSYSMDIQDLRHTCNNIEKVLSKQLSLHNEAAILNRFIYKFDKKFRSDIGYRNLKKVNSAINKFKSLNLLKDIENVNSLLPTNCEDNYLPTQQMLQYVLVRIVSFSMIMKRICTCSKVTAVYYMDRVKRGESHWMSLMPFALLSRIWSLSLVLLQHCCSWYSCLYPYLDNLKLKGVEFLPDGYILPRDLDQWIDIKNIDNSGRFQWVYQKSVQIHLEFTEDDIMNYDSILNYVKDVNKNEQPQDTWDNVKTNEPTKLSCDVTVKPFDEGQTISREHFQSFFNLSKEKENVHSADKVINKTTLDLFITNEERYRNQNSDNSLTKHLSFMQWQSLKSSLLKLSDSLSYNRKIERKFKKIWKEKCLDCL
ncbi:hypothetical protein evm_009229 [Chilo suppressalis]|nr:hypothetical protein evm_009229 [Chilo suppressalis]